MCVVVYVRECMCVSVCVGMDDERERRKRDS